MDPEITKLIDKLLLSWSAWQPGLNDEFYVNTHIPAMMRDDWATSNITGSERDLARRLQRLLSEEEWADLPNLICDRKHGLDLADREITQKRQTRIRTAHDAKVAQQKREDEERAAAEQRLLAQARAALERQEHEKRLAMERRTRTDDARRRVYQIFESDFLNADRRCRELLSATDIDPLDYEALKAEFVRVWVSRELELELDPEQAAAVAAVDGDVLVVARAGAGKTRTLVTRAVLLQKLCGVSPGAMLLLAFNRKAADEMRARLADAIDGELPHVMTFHALAYALVHPDEDLLFDDAGADALRLSQAIQDVIDGHIRSQEFGGRIRDLMLAHFRGDWERIVDGRFVLAMDEFLAHRRSLPRESLRGEYVKSFGEKVIANALFEHGVDYRYERNFLWDGVNYRPDFTIRAGDRGVVIEYFGLRGDPDYDESVQSKREFWSRQTEWTLLEYSPDDLIREGVDQFIERLLADLNALYIPWRQLTEEDVWELVKRRALDGFTSAMRNFVGRCRKRNLSPEGVASLVSGHTACSRAEKDFLQVGLSIYTGYLRRLVDSASEDFDGVMWRAIATLGSGQTKFKRDRGRERGDLAQMRFVLIDEFQDFSEMFWELAKGIRTASPAVEFFCVGDDWQAINGFAGSDLAFFQNFETHFVRPVRYEIRTNYRSPKTVVEIGNAIMNGRGPASASSREEHGDVWLCALDEFVPSAIEHERHNGDEITPVVLRLTRRLLDRGHDVVLLSRRNGLPWYVRYGETASRVSDHLDRFLAQIREHLPEEDRGRVTISTAHKYKGLEEQAVIVLDAVKRSYPLIHPNWVFNRVFGDTLDRLEDEERRLFYVAVTRAEQSLARVTERPTESPYLSDIRRAVPLPSLRWSDLPPVPSLDGPRLEVRVFGGYFVRDALKALNFTWDQRDQCWRKAVLAEGFLFETLLEQPWHRGRVRVEVRSETGELLHAG